MGVRSRVRTRRRSHRSLALGLRCVLRSGRGATWGPIVIAMAAVGFIISGLVPTDPALGYPPGEPPTATLAGRIHQGAGTLVFGGLSAAAFILARRLRSDARGLATVGWPAPTGILENRAHRCGCGGWFEMLWIASWGCGQCPHWCRIGSYVGRIPYISGPLRSSSRPVWGGRIRVLPKSNHVAFAVPEIRIPARRGNRHPASYRLAALMYYSTRCTHLQG